MTCITKQHVGKYTYLYESTSYRNEQGQPRNKKVRIGKLDPKTGEPVYDPEYLARKNQAEDTSCSSSANELDNGILSGEQKAIIEEALDSTKSFGVYCLILGLKPPPFRRGL